MRQKLDWDDPHYCADLFKNFVCALYYPQCIEATIAANSTNSTASGEQSKKICWATCFSAMMACNEENEEVATYLCTNYVNDGYLTDATDFECYAAAPRQRALVPLLVTT